MSLEINDRTAELEKIIAGQKQELKQKNHEIAQLIYAVMIAKKAVQKSEVRNRQMVDEIQAILESTLGQ